MDIDFNKNEDAMKVALNQVKQRMDELSARADRSHVFQLKQLNLFER